MKTIIISVLILQALYFPVYVNLCKKGFLYYDFPFFKLALNIILFFVLVFGLERNLAVSLTLFAFGFLIIDSFMGMETVYFVYEKIMAVVFKKDTSSTWNFIPLIKINTIESQMIQARMDWENLVILCSDIKNRRELFPYGQQDILVRGACSTKKIYQFLVLGWYGEEIAKMAVLGTLLFFI